VPREDETIRDPFYVTVPSTTAPGDYTVNATVYWHGKTWKAHTTVKVNRPTGDQPDSKP